MQRYAKFRVLLLGVLLTTATFLAANGWAQPTTAPTGPAEVKKQGLMDLILSHPDPVFFTIAALSIAGLALIFQGFIKTREAVFMPPASTSAIRDLIAERRFKELIDYT